MHRAHRLALAALLAFTTLTLGSGCVGGAVLGDDEGNVIGSKSGDQVTYDTLVRKTTTELLLDAAQERRAQGKKKIAFVGMDNQSAEELGDFRAALYDNINAIVTGEQVFTMISNRFVEAAMRESGIRSADQLFLRAPKEAFLGVLARDGMIPDYLLWAKVTSKTSDAEGIFVDTRDRTYQMTLEMVDANTGETISLKQGTFRKRYTR